MGGGGVGGRGWGGGAYIIGLLYFFVSVRRNNRGMYFFFGGGFRGWGWSGVGVGGVRLYGHFISSGLLIQQIGALFFWLGGRGWGLGVGWSERGGSYVVGPLFFSGPARPTSRGMFFGGGEGWRGGGLDYRATFFLRVCSSNK